MKTMFTQQQGILEKELNALYRERQRLGNRLEDLNLDPCCRDEIGDDFDDVNRRTEGIEQELDREVEDTDPYYGE